VFEGTEHYPYFITMTVVEWLPVFTSEKYCRILTDAFVKGREVAGLQIFAWVILDNHLHAIVKAPDLRKTLQTWKSHTARGVIDQLAADGRKAILDQLAFYRKKSRTGSQYQLWQDGYRPKIIDTDEIWDQKVDYIHYNPVKRGLVSHPEDWRYSSAHEWRENARPVFTCDRARPDNDPSSRSLRESRVKSED
jgi:REP element-mobilizing transposase RayT